MLEKAYNYYFKLMPTDIDFTKRASIITLFGQILNAAVADSTSQGIGIDTLQSRGITWVLSRIGIEVKEYPYQYETVQVQTWVESVTKLTNTRHYVFYNEAGKELARAASYWSIIDMSTRRPQNLQEIEVLKPQLIIPQPNEMVPPARVNDITGEKVFEHLVRYSDVDFNLHANSVHYLEWLMDSYEPEFIQKNHLARIDINYQHEAHYNETIQVVKESEGQEDTFSIKNQEGKTLCKTKLIWK